MTPVWLTRYEGHLHQLSGTCLCAAPEVCVPAPTATPVPQSALRHHRQRCDYLGVTDRTIRQMIVDGRLTGYRNRAKLIRLNLNEIDAAWSPSGVACDEQMDNAPNCSGGVS